MIRPRASATGSWLEHLLHGALAAQEHAAQADGHDRVPVVRLGLEQALGMAAGDDRVVDDHIQPPGARPRCVTSRSMSSQLPASASTKLAAAALLADQLDRRRAALAGVAADVADHHVRALPANASDIARPSPEAPPVTAIVFPSSLSSAAPWPGRRRSAA